jgi:hypothetical protein
MFSIILAGIIRTVAATLGGYLVAKGIADQGVVNEVTGGLITIGTGLWSAAAKSDKFPAIKF